MTEDASADRSAPSAPIDPLLDRAMRRSSAARGRSADGPAPTASPAPATTPPPSRRRRRQASGGRLAIAGAAVGGSLAIVGAMAAGVANAEPAPTVEPVIERRVVVPSDTPSCCSSSC